MQTAVKACPFAASTTCAAGLLVNDTIGQTTLHLCLYMRSPWQPRSPSRSNSLSWTTWSSACRILAFRTTSQDLDGTTARRLHVFRHKLAVTFYLVARRAPTCMRRACLHSNKRFMRCIAQASSIVFSQPTNHMLFAGFDPVLGHQVWLAGWRSQVEQLTAPL